jgi:hypothetical protein
METMQLPRMYRSIYLAGPTFNLLPDDNHARRALERAHSHLVAGGAFLVPLFIPAEMPDGGLGRPKVVYRRQRAWWLTTDAATRSTV